jgi:hypothetical protein
MGQLLRITIGNNDYAFRIVNPEPLSGGQGLAASEKNHGIPPHLVCRAARCPALHGAVHLAGCTITAGPRAGILERKMAFSWSSIFAKPAAKAKFKRVKNDYIRIVTGYSTAVGISRQVINVINRIRPRALFFLRITCFFYFGISNRIAGNSI